MELINRVSWDFETSRQLTQLGHEVIVAHAQNVRLIGESRRKDDRLDARILARLARMDPRLLSPVQHRSAEALLAEVASLSQRIAEYDQRIEQIAREVHPEVALRKQVKGVGTLIALTFVLTVEIRAGFATAAR